MQENNANRSETLQNCKITVIVPVYNAELYLGQCLESILSQTVAELDVICVDDGSTDDSRVVLYGYAVKDKRIRIFEQKNRGAASARNRGIAEACGRYIAFIDADDYYPASDVLEKLYTAAEENGVNVSGGSFTSLENGAYVTEYPPDFAGYTFRRNGLVRFSDYQFDYGFHRFLYRADFLREKKLVFPEYARYQDPPFLARTLDAAGTFYALQEATYVYRVGHNTVEWNLNKTLGLISGIADNLEFSARKGYAKLHRLNWDRLNSDYYSKIIVRQARRPGNREIAKKLAELQSVASGTLLGVPGGKTPLNRPLKSLLKDWSALDEKIYNEGWFIYRKIFRLYTWPVRVLGKFLRRFRRAR